MARKIKIFCLWILLLLFIGGCAGISKGVTSAFLDKTEKEKDTRACDIKGHAFTGLEAFMQRQEDSSGKNERTSENRPTLKVLMIHGIGSPDPGYSTRFSTNLTRELKLGVMEERAKEIDLMKPSFGDVPLGHLTVKRYFNKSKTRELIFYELTWSKIIEEEKKKIDYDNSGEYSFKRANINKSIKTFVNSHMPDPMIYLGESQKKILVSVTQSFCWMFSLDWEDLEYEQRAFCEIKSKQALENMEEDNHVIVTHSLGSRIIIDSLQWFTAETPDVGNQNPQEKIFLKFLEKLKNKKFPIFMLANQLPLLQLGRKDPEVTGQIDQYCREGGEKQQQRMFKELPIAAFSDPNDILSYEIPPKYAMESMDSRICPKMTNISINVAKVISVLGLGNVANPAVAHSGYDDDERVINLIVYGLGNEGTSQMIKDRCTWLETVSD